MSGAPDANEQRSKTRLLMEDCNPDRVTPTVSGTSLVPDDVLALMYPSG